MKKTFLTSIFTAALFVPMFVGAQVKITTENNDAINVQPGTTTLAYVFTSCSQASIETRDSSIASARTTYNADMAVALNARKDAEKNAVTLEESAKKDAIQVTVDAYKKSVTNAQEKLTDARTKAWAGFEKDMEGCRQYNKDEKPMVSTMMADKKAAVAPMIAAKKEAIKEVVTDKKAEAQTLRADQKAVVNASAETRQAEVHTLRDTFKAQLNALLAFFTKKPQVSAEAEAKVSQ